MTTVAPEPRGELELIRRLAARLAPPGAPRDPVAFGDDMALLDAAGPLLWTVDMLMDGVDFDSRRHPWDAIGRKAMAVNLSDCAAMAVEPIAALCAVALAEHLSLADAETLIAAADACGRQYGCPIVGGDTNSWAAPTVISITIAGRPRPGVPPVRRDGARPGDTIWLSGPVGGSILGRHLTFEPRVALALELAARLRPHALIDISDGLALDLSRILTASGCGAVLDAAALDAVLHPDATRLAAADGRSAREHGLYDGEDFELIAVLPPDAPASDAAALGLRWLGRIVADPGLWLAPGSGAPEPLPIRGWEHFR